MQTKHPAIGYHLKVSELSRKAADHSDKAAELHGEGKHDEAAHHAYLAFGYHTQANEQIDKAVQAHTTHASALRA